MKIFPKMTKLILVALLLVAVAQAQEIKVKQPKDIKIRIEDTGSRVLTAEEVNKLSPEQIAEAKPVKQVEDMKALIDLKAAVMGQEKSPSVTADESQPQLPPIAPIFPQSQFLSNLPSFVQDILKSMPFGDMTNGADSSSNNLGEPRRIISVLLMKSKMNGGGDEPSFVQGAPSGSEQQQPIKSSFFIFRFMPKLMDKSEEPAQKQQHLLGGDDDVDRKMMMMGGHPHMFGGDDDVDKKMVRPHLLGGGGENDPDLMRFKIDPMFTGNDDLFINKLNQQKMNDDSDDDDDDDDDDENEPDTEKKRRPEYIFSILDRIRNFFNNNGFTTSDISSPSGPSPIVIKTDDGSSVLLPNEFGYGRPADEQNKCLMLSFMRLKASMYYRTVLHLLFFSGVLLFVLFMILLTVKSYKKRKYTTLRYFPHNMSVVSTIDGSGAEEGGNKVSKCKFMRSLDSNMMITCPDVKSVLINAPPSYDQESYAGNKPVVEADTQSLPPEYESDNEKGQQK